MAIKTAHLDVSAIRKEHGRWQESLILRVMIALESIILVQRKNDEGRQRLVWWNLLPGDESFVSQHRVEAGHLVFGSVWSGELAVQLQCQSVGHSAIGDVETVEEHGYR